MATKIPVFQPLFTIMPAVARGRMRIEAQFSPVCLSPVSSGRIPLHLYATNREIFPTIAGPLISWPAPGWCSI